MTKGMPRQGGNGSCPGRYFGRHSDFGRASYCATGLCLSPVLDMFCLGGKFYCFGGKFCCLGGKFYTILLKSAIAGNLLPTAWAGKSPACGVLTESLLLAVSVENCLPAVSAENRLPGRVNLLS
ncbi:hypothetical protein V6N13_030704 [Hibiscus sabdariffa]